MVLAIYGTGGAGKEAFQIAKDIQRRSPFYDDLIFIDDTKPAGTFRGFPCVPFEQFLQLYTPENSFIHVAMGELIYKELVTERVLQSGFPLKSLIHPDCILGCDVTLGRGVHIKMGARVDDHVTIGDGCWINGYASIGHDSVIGPFCQLSANAKVGANVVLDNKVMIAMHAEVEDGLHLEEFSVAGMGSLVTKDLPREAICLGRPGRVMSNNTRHKLF